MSQAGAAAGDWRDAGRLATAIRSAGPPLLFGLRLWASVCLALYVAFWLELDNAYWAGTSAALVAQPHLGASLRKGWFRMIGTVVGAVVIVLLTAAFPQDRARFLIGLALWGAVCALVATLLRNFASYSATLAGFTAAIIATDELGATGGTNGLAFTLAITRASEICIGIVCAGIVLAATDLGGARRRLAASASPHQRAARPEFRHGTGAHCRSAPREHGRNRAACPTRQPHHRAVRHRSGDASRARGARDHPCDVRRANPAQGLLRCGGVRMKFIEINLFGVYVAPISVLMVAAWVITIALRRLGTRFGCFRNIWHPALFTMAVYMIVLSSMVLVVAR